MPAWIQWIIDNWQVLVGIVLGILTVIIAIARLFPGPQPEKFLQSIVDLIAKISKKPPKEEGQ